MSLDDFKQQYAAGGTAIECVCSRLERHGSQVDRSFASSRSKAKINFSAAKEGAPEEQIYIFYAEEASVGIKTMRKCVESRSACACDV